MHAARPVAWIIEIIHHRERQAVAVGEPFDGRAGLARDEPNERFVCLAVRLGLDVAAEQIRRIGKLKRALEARSRGRYEAR